MEGACSRNRELLSYLVLAGECDRCGQAQAWSGSSRAALVFLVEALQKAG